MLFTRLEELEREQGKFIEYWMVSVPSSSTRTGAVETVGEFPTRQTREDHYNSSWDMQDERPPPQTFC